MHTIGYLGLFAAVLGYTPRLSHEPPSAASVADTSGFRSVMVKGRVIDDLAAPVDNALIEVTSPADGRTMAARTDANGDYSLRAPSSGRFDVRVRRIGFRPARFAVADWSHVGIVVANVQLLPTAPVIVL